MYYHFYYGYPLKYNSPHVIYPINHYQMQTPYYYPNASDNIVHVEREADYIPEQLTTYASSGSSRFSETRCSRGVKGKKITSGKRSYDIFTFKYEVYECEIKVVTYVGEHPVRTDVLNREKRGVSYSHGGTPYKQKVTLEVKDKALQVTIEIYSRINFLGRTQENLIKRIGPVKLGSWNRLKF